MTPTIQPVKTLAVIGLLLVSVVVATVGCGKTSNVDRLANAAESGDMETVKALLQQGVPINQASSLRFKWTPLISAINADQTNIVYYLVDHGADVNLADKNGETPLMWQTYSGDQGIEVIKFLLVHGADVNAMDHLGATVMSYARSDPPKPRIIEAIEQARPKTQNGSQH